MIVSAKGSLTERLATSGDFHAELLDVLQEKSAELAEWINGFHLIDKHLVVFLLETAAEGLRARSWHRRRSSSWTGCTKSYRPWSLKCRRSRRTGMAVLIPDIGIPKTCSDCPCYDAEYEICNLTKTEIVWSRPALTSRAEDCPLIEIVRCRECVFWKRPPSCEGLARCQTGETGVRYRAGYDFCSRGKCREEDEEDGDV